MAAGAEISVLLFALINNIHAEELIMVRQQRDSQYFIPPEEANTSCLISRFVGEEKLVLWNTSDLWSQNSMVPKDLKRRLSFVSEVNISSFIIHGLTHSDSGPYQEECWTEGHVTHEKHISITVCTSIDREITRGFRLGETAELPCEGAADNQDVQWLKRDSRYKEEIWTRVFGDKTTLVMDNVRGRYQMVKNTSALRVSNVTMTDFRWYMCLRMNQQQCVSSSPVRLQIETETIYRSVGETAVMPCTVTDVTDVTDVQPPRWSEYTNIDLGHQNTSVDQNYTLVFSSLTLNHSGWYYCTASITVQSYRLVVCPKFGPSAVEFFSEGEDVTVRCRSLEERMGQYWFIKSNRTEGRVVEMSDLSNSRVSWNSDGTVVISNISLEDTGEYWCAVIDRRRQCVSTSRTLLKSREPSGILSVIYAVRCAVLSALLLTLCVAVVAVNLRTLRTRRTRRTPQDPQDLQDPTGPAGPAGPAGPRRTRRTQRGEQLSADTES